MKVAFQLRKRPAAQPATALLLASHDVGELLDLCVRVGTDPLPQMFAVADGFLLLLNSATTAALPRTVRLRRLADHLLLPADADLLPPLHDDEARALTRQRGLIFLPGGRTLAFDADKPMSLAALIAPGSIRREEWGSFPPRPERVERIESIRLELPLPPPDAILDAGNPAQGDPEETRPAAGGALSTLGSRIEAAAGKGLMGLGNLLGWKGLAAAGARWIDKAVKQVPRLTESILGRQEAALRELLRQFREGNLEDALKRALPVGGAGGRGGHAATDAQLPRHSLGYSLSNLLGLSGPASIWLGGYDVQAELAKEYRRAAEEAQERGDYRRAAFIYGRLLSDYRRAADVLFAGGLYTDAAQLYLNLLDDRRAAARAFAAAGDIDRAVELYRHLGDHVAAADLLRQAGEEEKAMVHYQLAADQLAAKRDWLGAGELLVNKAQRPDLAPHYWREGWALRPNANDVPCALRLARHHADEQVPARLLVLMQEGRSFFEPAGNDVAAGQFFNGLAALARDHPALSDVRDEVRDHARMGLARKLDQNSGSARRGDLVSQLLGQPGTWPAALVTDAHHALRSVPMPAVAAVVEPARVKLGEGMVTAAVAAQLSGEVFVGFEDGAIVCFRPQTSEVVRFPGQERTPVTSLAVSPGGEVVSSLRIVVDTDYNLQRFRRRADGAYEMQCAQSVLVRPSAFLVPAMFPERDDDLVGLWKGEEFYLRGATVPVGQFGPAAEFWSRLLPTQALLLPSIDAPGKLPDLLVLGSEAAWYVWPTERAKRIDLGWQPGVPPGGSLPQALLSWHLTDTLELVALDREGVLRWAHMFFNQNGPLVMANTAWSEDGPCLAAALVRPGLAVAVCQTGIVWLRRNGHKLAVVGRTLPRLANPVACFASLATNEVLIVCEDGTLARIRIPV